MPRGSVKKVSDRVLANTILEMRDDLGYWDQDPIVFKLTEKAYNALGKRAAKGIREVLRRVEKDGLAAHEPLKRIFKKAAKMSREELKDPHTFYNALRDIKRKREPKPGYAF